ncbi:glycosyltransferase family 4 protein [Conexibacter sp. SYSU D00693]|uniref:glycosyltransferase family 4 protein n=1 Tax=Conexibacter sp. SYSU D00693 TaxID=2812560 RepID=UPI00196AA5C1|nr:glycosyltransferase family 4 protein [Conexibacter sp. SYSU D00693]
MTTTVLLARGHQATAWELRPWEALPARFSVRLARSRANGWDVSSLGLESVEVRTVLDAVPAPLGRPLRGLLGDRYRGLSALLEGVDVVHAEELGYWFAADVARARLRGADVRVVQTAWETLPLLDAYRTAPARRRRREVLEGTDLFLAATQRAADALLLEGVPAEKVSVSAPGIDVGRFAAAAVPAGEREDLIVSPGRLVWEKGHQDVLRALALLRRRGASVPHLRIVGSGPEEERLRRHADELGIGDRVRIGAVPYDEMPSVLGRARAMCLMSLPSAGGGLHPLDVPHVFWEEQFGMVFAEALAAGTPIVTTASGAIPEVVDGVASVVAPGDWPALADLLAAGVPVADADLAAERLGGWSLEAAADRLAAAYDRVR